jgi:SAM-dependent methyltransferase
LHEPTPYQQRLAQEIEQFRAIPNIHELPRIYHYWAGRYLIPAQAELFGTGDITQIFVDNFLASAQASPARFLSLGAGDCAGEIEIARRMRLVRPDFTIECIELSPALLARARAAAGEAGLSANLVFTEVDINQWRAQGAYSAVMAHHSLHHIVELEHVFDEVRAALQPHGRFVVSDMIGRNGHMRWPEAEVLLQGLWRTLPPSKRYNHQLARLEPTFVNWDCAQEGFEGVRAQDILPLMLERFDFPVFLGFGNLTDVFLDRAFGHNFDPDSVRDREFIDRIHAVNEFLVDVGYLKPTMMIAVATHRDKSNGGGRCYRGWEPSYCVRATSEPNAVEADALLGVANTAEVSLRWPRLEGDSAKNIARKERIGVEPQTAQLEAAEQEIRRLKSALAAVYRSTSWRLTTPLRWLKTRGTRRLPP